MFISVFVAVSLVFPSCQKLKDVESIIKIVELNGDDLVKDFSNEIERMLGSKMKSVKVRTTKALLGGQRSTLWPRGEMLFSFVLRG